MDRGAAILGNAILDLLLPFIKAECLTRGYVEDREKQGVLRLSAVTLAYFVPSDFENHVRDFLVYPYSIDRSLCSVLSRLLPMSC